MRPGGGHHWPTPVRRDPGAEAGAAAPEGLATTGFLLGRTARSLRRSWGERIAATGASPAQAAVLRALRREERVGIRRLARTLATDAMNVKHLADQLEARGLLTSETDPGDRRTRCLVLSETGRALAVELDRLAEEQEEWFRASLGRGTVTRLAETLRGLESLLAKPRQHGPEAWDERHRTRPFSPDPDPLVLEVAGALPLGRALDLGCGAGRNALGLAEAGWTVTGVDFSAVALDQLGSSAAARGVTVSTVRSDLLTFRPPDPPVDLCLIANVHLPDAEMREVLTRARGALVEGGHLLLVGHHLEGLPGHGPAGAGLLLSEERVARLLPTGFEVERLERHQRSRGGDLGEVEDLVLLLLARRLPG